MARTGEGGGEFWEGEPPAHAKAVRQHRVALSGGERVRGGSEHKARAPRLGAGEWISPQSLAPRKYTDGSRPPGQMDLRKVRAWLAARGHDWRSELQTAMWAAWPGLEPGLRVQTPLDPRVCYYLAAPRGACLYPQTGPGPPAPSSTLAPQMGVEGQGW